MFRAVYPISGEDLTALPVRETGPAVSFYTSVLGFAAVRSDETAAVVRRDNARLGLVRKPDHRPEEAGSCCFVVDDLDAMHRELEGRGLDLGAIDAQDWGGKKYRVFFLRESHLPQVWCPAGGIVPHRVVAGKSAAW
jgi:hypothetical protein